MSNKPVVVIDSLLYVLLLMKLIRMECSDSLTSCAGSIVRVPPCCAHFPFCLQSFDSTFPLLSRCISAFCFSPSWFSLSMPCVFELFPLCLFSLLPELCPYLFVLSLSQHNTTQDDIPLTSFTNNKLFTFYISITSFECVMCALCVLCVMRI